MEAYSLAIGDTIAPSLYLYFEVQFLVRQAASLKEKSPLANVTSEVFSIYFRVKLCIADHFLKAGAIPLTLLSNRAIELWSSRIATGNIWSVALKSRWLALPVGVQRRGPIHYYSVHLCILC